MDNAAKAAFGAAPHGGEADPGCLDGHWDEKGEALHQSVDGNKPTGSLDELGAGEPNSESDLALLPQLEPVLISLKAPRGARFDENEDTKVVAALASICKGYNLTDSGNADRLVKRYGDLIRYCPPHRRWLVWDSRRWIEDRQNAIMKFARTTARLIHAEASKESEDNRRQALAKWAISSEFKERMNGMILLAAADPDITVIPEGLDANGNLFNLWNGTLELDTLTFREHRRADLLTKIAGVGYDKEASCPRWEAHIRLVADGDEEVIRSIQELFGYAMLQGNPLQIFPIWWGSGSNGKSVTLAVQRALFGDYSVAAAPELFMDTRPDGRPRPDLLELRGARLVTAAETKKGQRLNEELVKQLTGGEPVKARGLYKEFETFPPSHLAILATNPRPVVSGDFAIMRRIILYPFVNQIPEKQRVGDYEKVLLKEASGILNWMIAGLRRYYQNGNKITVPTVAKVATEEYATEMNPIAQFLDEECVLDENGIVPRHVIYGVYRTFCEDLDTMTMDQRQFAAALKERGILDGPKITGTRHWKGVRMKRYEEVTGDAPEEAG